MLKPGRELDALVAEKVMGYSRRPFDPKKEFIIGMSEDQQKDIDWTMSCPHYSTDIAAAWEVVEKLKHCDFRLAKDYDFEFWICIIREVSTTPHPIEFRGITAPHVICLAALKAVGEYLTST